MTPLNPLPQSPQRPSARHRRVKRGIVAGYLHELTQRHGAPVSRPVPTTATPVAVAARSEA